MFYSLNLGLEVLIKQSSKTALNKPLRYKKTHGYTQVAKTTKSVSMGFNRLIWGYDVKNSKYRKKHLKIVSFKY